LHEASALAFVEVPEKVWVDVLPQVILFSEAVRGPDDHPALDWLAKYFFLLAFLGFSF
jgi:hypothetical protein